MTATHHILRRLILGICAATLLLPTVSANVNDLQSALALASKHQTIADAGGSMKLYSLTANYNGKDKRWRFQFYDGKDKLHNVHIDQAGKIRYHARNKGNLRIFDHVELKTLPHPSETLIHNLVEQARKALKALNFKLAEKDTVYIRYQLHNHLTHKNKAYHVWTVTLPVGDGKQGKNVSFKDGSVDTISNAIIHGE